MQKIGLLTAKGFRLARSVFVINALTNELYDLSTYVPANGVLMIMVEGNSEVAKLMTYRTEPMGNVLIADDDLRFIMRRANFQIYETDAFGRQIPTTLRFRFNNPDDVALFTVALA